MILTSWQMACGNMYTSTSDVTKRRTQRDRNAAAGRADLQPVVHHRQAADQAVRQRRLVTGDPSLDALFAAGVGTPNLLKQSYRQAVLSNPQHPAWVAAAKKRPARLDTDTSDRHVLRRAGSLRFTARIPPTRPLRSPQGRIVTHHRMNLEDAATVGPTLAGGFAAAKAAAAADPTLGARRQSALSVPITARWCRRSATSPCVRSSRACWRRAL